MRKLTDCERRAQAQALVDDLAVEGIESAVRSEGPWEVWVRNDDDLPLAREHLERWHLGGARPDAHAAAARSRPPVPVTGRWIELRARRERAQSLPALTVILAATAIMVGLHSDMGDHTLMTVQNLSIEPWATNGLCGPIQSSAEVFAHVRAGEIWRLFTPVLIHFGLIHLCFNLSWLTRFGSQIERLHGTGTMAILVLGSALVGNVGQYLASGPSFGGLSGVVFGLFGFVWIHARYQARTEYTITDHDTVLMLVWFVVCALLLRGSIANVGHAGGLLVGLLLGLPSYLRHRHEQHGHLGFAKGSWADINIKGWRRIVRRHVTPYAPLWLLVLTLVVMLSEWLLDGSP